MQAGSRKISTEEQREKEGDDRWHEDAACFDAFARDVDSGRYDKSPVVPLAVLDEMLN